MRLAQPVQTFPAIHFRHRQIKNRGIQRDTVVSDTKCLQATVCRDDDGALLLQNRLVCSQNDFFVIDNQQRAAGKRRRRTDVAPCAHGLANANPGKYGVKKRSARIAVLAVDFASRPSRYGGAGEQAKAGSALCRLGGKKRIKNAFADVVSDPRTGNLNSNDGPPTGNFSCDRGSG